MSSMGKNAKEIESKVIQILLEKIDGLDKGKITSDADLRKDLGMDSFGAVEIIFGVKEVFGVDVPNEDLPKIKTVKDIVDYISSRH